MTDFKIGGRVWVELQVVETSGDMIQVISDPNQQPYQTAVLGWAHASDLRSSAGPDLKQAIREVLLSDEFIEAFTKRAFGAKVEVAIPAFTTLQNVSTERSLEHPIPGVNRPMKSSEPTKAQQLADRTLKAIWQTNDGGDQ